MSVWKKIATPSGGVSATSRAAVSENHAFHSASESAGSSETSGSEVTTEQPSSDARSASQTFASAVCTVRVGAIARIYPRVRAKPMPVQSN